MVITPVSPPSPTAEPGESGVLLSFPLRSSPHRSVAAGDTDDGEESADDDLPMAEPDDEESDFDDFDDEFDDDFEEEEDDPDWDHPDDLEPEPPAPGKAPGKGSGKKK